MTTMQVGDTVTRRTLEDIAGGTVTVPDPDRLVHLQFRRYAGCPICNVHLRSVAQRHDELVAAGVREVAVFHSDAEEMRQYQADLPFDVIADPERQLYREFGVGRGVRAVLSGKAIGAAVRGVARRTTTVAGAASLGEDHFGLPADLLIGLDGTILARRDGAHAADQWTVDEVLSLARQHAVDPA